MPIMFNTILREAGLPVTDVRLVRHKDKRATRGRTPYELWGDELRRPQFELYQSIQSIPNRKKLTAPYWAVFIVNLNDETMFAGVYAVRYRGLLEQDTPKPLMDGIDEVGSGDVYDLTLQDTLSDLIGKLLSIGAREPSRGCNTLIGTISPSRNCAWRFGNPGFLAS